MKRWTWMLGVIALVACNGEEQLVGAASPAPTAEDMERVPESAIDPNEGAEPDPRFYCRARLQFRTSHAPEVKDEKTFTFPNPNEFSSPGEVSRTNMIQLGPDAASGALEEYWATISLLRKSEGVTQDSLILDLTRASDRATSTSRTFVVGQERPYINLSYVHAVHEELELECLPLERGAKSTTGSSVPDARCLRDSPPTRSRVRGGRRPGFARRPRDRYQSTFRGCGRAACNLSED